MLLNRFTRFYLLPFMLICLFVSFPLLFCMTTVCVISRAVHLFITFRIVFWALFFLSSLNHFLLLFHIALFFHGWMCSDKWARANFLWHCFLIFCSSYFPHVLPCLPVGLVCELFTWYMKFLVIFTCIICVISLCAWTGTSKEKCVLVSFQFIYTVHHVIGDKQRNSEFQ